MEEKVKVLKSQLQLQLEEVQRMKTASSLLEMQLQAYQTLPAPNVNVTATIGTMAEFKAGQDWTIYQKRLEQYFITNSLAESKKVSTLITLIDEETYKTLSDLCDPNSLEDKSYKDLCEILTEQFAPKISVFKERREFYAMTQGELEPVNIYFAKLKKKAVHCKFGNRLQDTIRDKFVTGLNPGPILDRVCEESHTTSLESILEVARKKEAALTMKQSSNSNLVHKVNVARGGASKSSKSYNTAQTHKDAAKTDKTDVQFCRHCGDTDHNFAKCKYKTYVCKNCRTVVHLIKVCPYLTSKKSV